MAIILTQTDTVADSGFNVGCSGGTAGGTTASREATEGGTAGVSEATVDTGGILTRVVLAFQTDTAAPTEPDTTNWQAGDYVVRLNVTTSNMNGTWVATYVCERTSGGTYNTVASLTGQSTSLAATGVQTHTVNRGTDYAASSGSTLYIVCEINMSSDHGGTAVGITPDQDIDTPIEIPGAQQSTTVNRIYRASLQPNIRM